MIAAGGVTRILVATKPVDFRRGAVGLAALVSEHLQADPFSGAIYVFRSKRAAARSSWAWMALSIRATSRNLAAGTWLKTLR